MLSIVAKWAFGRRARAEKVFREETRSA